MITIKEKGVNINQIKSKINSLMGETITLTKKVKYKSNKKLEGKITDTYLSFFLFSYDDRKACFSYADIGIGDVRIKDRLDLECVEH